ncbi:MAG TPA: RNA polymerase sigma factor [Gemmatimonadales bacterium]|nr:RNA polymerase sigma factor [Gemmatimonadales bacterium]
MRDDEPDGALVRRVLEGDTEAFAGLVARHRDRGLRFAASMLGDAAEAEEALQDAFVRAYRSLRTCRDPDRFGAWLLQILVNRCRTRGAGRRRRARLFVGDDGALERAAAPAGADPEWREEIDRALARLDPPQREAFLLKHVEGLDYEEMTRLTGARVPALKMRVKRACDRLRILLGEVPR